MPKIRTLKAFFSIIRPINCIMIGIGILIGEIVVAKFNLPLYKSIFAFFTGFFLTGAAMVLNDYIDLPVDRINAPNRPLPAGIIHPKVALAYYIILGFLGILFSSFIGLLNLVIAIAYFILSSLYDIYLKRTGLLGNFIVSSSVAIPFVFGAVVIENTISPLIMIFFTVAFLANTGREIIKGIADIEGDRLKNYNTVAVKYGPKIAAKLAAFFIIAAIILSPLPYILRYAGITYLIIVAISDLVFIKALVIILKDSSKDQALKSKKMILLAMFIALISFFTISFLP